MRNIWTIARREYSQYFNSPIAYVVALIIFLILGIIFYANILAASAQQFAPDITIVVGPLVTLFLFSTPAITMRSLAEEQRTGTMELLLTAPLRDAELVIGKWLGAFLFSLTIIVISLVFPLILNHIISPGIDQGMMVAAYLGLILLSATFIAIGVAVSSLFSNQIAAFFAGLGILIVSWMISYPVQAASSSTGGQILTYLDLSQHFYNTFFAGVIQLQDIVYYLSVTALALFLGSVSVELRRWR
jgi:ABC-2 type transport system permease protein